MVLIETVTTQHTGDVEHERSVSIERQIGTRAVAGPASLATRRGRDRRTAAAANTAADPYSLELTRGQGADRVSGPHERREPGETGRAGSGERVRQDQLVESISRAAAEAGHRVQRCDDEDRSRWISATSSGMAAAFRITSCVRSVPGHLRAPKTSPPATSPAATKVMRMAAIPACEYVAAPTCIAP